MSETINAASIHNNGKAEVLIGIRGRQFKIAYDEDLDQIVFTNAITGAKLALNPDNIPGGASFDADTGKLSMTTDDTLDTTKTYSVNGFDINGASVSIEDETARKSIETLTEEVGYKATKAVTLSGYGIKDAYTKTEIDAIVAELKRLINPEG